MGVTALAMMMITLQMIGLLVATAAEITLVGTFATSLTLTGGMLTGAQTVTSSSSSASSYTLGNTGVTWSFPAPLSSMVQFNSSGHPFKYLYDEQLTVAATTPRLMDQMVILSTDLYRVHLGRDQPMVTYYYSTSAGSGGQSFSCLPSLPSSAKYVNCSSLNSSAADAFRVSLMPPSQIDVQSSSSYTYRIVTLSGTTIPEAALYTIAMSRLQEFHRTLQVVSSIESSVNSRRSSSRVAVGFLWFFVATTIGFLCILTGLIQTWIWPICASFKHSVPSLIMFWISLTVILAATTGLGGFIAISVIMALFCVISNLIYCCVQLRKRQRARMAQVEVAPIPVPNSPTAVAAGGSAVIVVPTNAPKSDSVGVSAMTLKPTDVTGNSPLPPPSPAAATTINVTGALSPRRQLLKHVTGFSRLPDELGRKQKRYIGIFALLLLVGFLICVAVFGLWQVQDYKLWNRSSLVPNEEVEIIPQVISKGVSAVYVFDGYATKLKMDNVFFSVSTQWCGSKYNTLLTTNAEKVAAIDDEFIIPYEIDMSIYALNASWMYPTVNDWFKRRLAPGVRSIAAAADDSVIVSPADARLMVFNTVPKDSTIWIKGENFNLKTLIGSAGYDDKFTDGSMAIVRLAPQDYHRFHAPVTGNVTMPSYFIDGTLHSVNADGMTSKNDAQYNQRRVLIVEHPIYGKYAYIAIGATCVGSVVFGEGTHESVTKGNEVGYFQFGGSTIVLVFEKGRVEWNDDILLHSRQRVETHVQQGMRIGTFIN